MNDKEPKLVDGGEWMDHEDCIVGNESGLQALANACNEALETGQYYGNDLGDYVGVKKMPNEWFKAPSDSSQTKFANSALGVVLVALFMLIAIGIYQVGKWIFL